MGESIMSINRWENLLCHFFYSYCLNVLEVYFFKFGFKPEKTKIGGVLFRRDEIFVEISYVPETYPTYSPSVIIGIGATKYNDLGKTTGVPLWSVIPNNDKAKEYSMWKFSNESELFNVLNKIQNEILERFAKQLWEDRINLEIEVKKFQLQ